ncbi:MAG: glycogen/starch/alpha-glucan phosphorylase [Alphaproteobacteria bacterium]|nr:glycogen/starch/alpha-glucan phosphorylase [Alphaproteobacteria bacterium]
MSKKVPSNPKKNLKDSQNECDWEIIPGAIPSEYNLKLSKNMPAEKRAIVEKLAALIENRMHYSLCKMMPEASKDHIFSALAVAVRDYSVDKLFETAKRHNKNKSKKVYYLSIEYLLGRLLENNLRNLEIYDLLDYIEINNPVKLKDVIDAEYDPALGNGGLGRLAACFLDSMATLDLPGYGYGINYQFGLFKQYFDDGWQKEKADVWFTRSSPWQIERGDRTCNVQLYGRLVHENVNGKQVSRWVDTTSVVGVPFDMPIVGYGGRTVNFLRLFSAHSSESLDLSAFNEGGYIKAVEQKVKSETISKVLYPAADEDSGKELRLVQQYFFVRCSLHDILRRFFETEKDKDFEKLPDSAVIQLNDTHPSLAITELMRVMIDEHGIDFDKALKITQKTMAYTIHTILPEALEKWSVDLLQRVVPRHLEIIYQINQRLMDMVSAQFPGDFAKMERMSLIQEGPRKFVRMANLSIAGSMSVNGVAQLHTDIVKNIFFNDFYRLWPDKFNNKTNGITQRRWLLTANPEFADLITDHIGNGWITDLSQLRKLENYIDDASFVKSFYDIKRMNKEKLGKIIWDTTGVQVSPDSIFDCQVKRIHEYKRQLLNALHVAYKYLNIVDNGVTYPQRVTHIFGGKAFPSYEFAKLVIKFVNNLAQIINTDPRANNQMTVVFIPDYKVSVAERIFPASDVSEQISTAGFEASGTGNMKFALNGAVTIGTLDGANVEIREEVGEENFYLFGLHAEQVHEIQEKGLHRPWDLYNSDPRIRQVMEAVTNGRFGLGSDDVFKPIFKSLMFSDYFLLLADFGSYEDAHRQIMNDYQDSALWARKALLNVARVGKFSSDRTITEYARDIWKVKPTT